MHEADIKALLCRGCIFSTDDKGRWFSGFTELQRRQDSRIQPEFLHSSSSGFTHSSSAHPHKGMKDAPSAEVAYSSHMGPHLQLAQPRKVRRGSHSSSVQTCKAA